MNFIEEYQFEDSSFLDEIIQFFNNHPGKTAGTVGYADKTLVNPEVKQSTDLTLSYNDVAGNLALQKYMKSIQMAVDDYIKKYEWAGSFSPFGMEQLNIQHYKAGEGFYQWHTERTSKNLPDAARHLVFMTYLNDVTDGGETEFFYQKVKFVPTKGTSLIWPADWTHTHRGLTSPTQEKYIITGWIDYIN